MQFHTLFPGVLIVISIGSFFKKIARIVEAYDGFFERYIGDSVMAVFGIPRTHEDDPERAIHAGLPIHAAVNREDGFHGLHQLADRMSETGNGYLSAHGPSATILPRHRNGTRPAGILPWPVIRPGKLPEIQEKPSSSGSRGLKSPGVREQNRKRG